MEDRENEKFVTLTDLSGGVQSKTTEFLQKANEQEDAQNARYHTTGGIRRSEGYQKIGNNLTSTTTTSTSSSTTTTSTSTSTTSTSTSTTSTSTTSTSTTTT